MSDRISEFFDAWGISDPEAQHAQISAAMAADFAYADPQTDGQITDLDALAAYVAQFAANAPGWTAKQVSSDTTQGYTRALIAFGGKTPDGSDMVQHGTYFAQTDADGAITLLVGFVGTGAPA